MKPRIARAVTLRQVAEASGVSIATVAKVLHGAGGNVRVGETTELKVRAAAERLNYVPNGLARSMRTGRTETVGLIFERFGRISAGPLFYPQLLDGVCSVLFQHGFRLSILPGVDPFNAASSLADGRLDGVIWAKMPSTPNAAESLIGAGIPCVALGHRSPVPPERIPLVACDNAGGSELVARHLAELGHRRVAFVFEAGEEDNPDALDRFEGFRAAWGGALDVLTWSTEASELGAWRKKTRRATALYAWNENLGAAILRSASHIGMALPQEASVVGFDSTQYCDTTQPRLTAVRQPIFEMASSATRVLIDLCLGQTQGHPDQTFACALDVRDSTAPPAAAE